jgi:hypothetical protein
MTDQYAKTQKLKPEIEIPQTHCLFGGIYGSFLPEVSVPADKRHSLDHNSS